MEKKQRNTVLSSSCIHFLHLMHKVDERIQKKIAETRKFGIARTMEVLDFGSKSKIDDV